MRYEEWKSAVDVAEAKVAEIRDRYRGDLDAVHDRVHDVRDIVHRKYLIGSVRLRDDHAEAADFFACINSQSSSGIASQLSLSVVTYVGLDFSGATQHMTPEMFRRLAVVRELLDDYIAGRIDALPVKAPWA